jgi:hypothetical protein
LRPEVATTVKTGAKIAITYERTSARPYLTSACDIAAKTLPSTLGMNASVAVGNSLGQQSELRKTASRLD